MLQVIWQEDKVTVTQLLNNWDFFVSFLVLGFRIKNIKRIIL